MISDCSPALANRIETCRAPVCARIWPRKTPVSSVSALLEYDHLTATTLTALWFTRRRGTALGIVSAVGAAGISLAPVVLERLIATTSWRTAW